MNSPFPGLLPARQTRSRTSLGKLLFLFPSVACLVLLPALSLADSLRSVHHDQSFFRRPVAIARLDTRTAVVANRSGTLSVVDLEKWSVAAEFKIGGRPTDVAVTNGRVLVTDALRSQLLTLDITRSSARCIGRTPLPAHPVSVRVSPDGAWCSVASLWGRRLTLITPSGSGSESAVILKSIALPFSPREQVLTGDRSKLIVADAFGGRLAVIDIESRAVRTVHEFGAHNIRGLAIKPDTGRLLISHQLLNHKAVPRRSDIIWGVMVDNTIRELNLNRVITGQQNAVQGGRFISVGYAGQGAGDPDSLFVDDQARTVIALAGVGEVSIVEADGNGFRRVAVGRRPVALLPVSPGRFVAVNELSDSLSLIDLTVDPATQRTELSPAGDLKVPDSEYDGGSYGSTYLDSGISVRHLSLGDTPVPGPAERGEALFFDARLSHANWFSCHSCHTDGHSNGGLADTFGDNSTGAPKRVLSLLGVGETGPWGWNGAQASLSAQVHQSARSTMKGPGLSTTDAADLVAFLKTLTPPPPFQKADSAPESKIVNAGRQLFESLNCTDCHTGRTLTSSQTYDVGLVDERGLKRYSPPSLRGVGHRTLLFHDGRASGVVDVITRFQHQLPRPLDSGEQQRLIRFLNSL